MAEWPNYSHLIATHYAAFETCFEVREDVGYLDQVVASWFLDGDRPIICFDKSQFMAVAASPSTQLHQMVTIRIQVEE